MPYIDRVRLKPGTAEKIGQELGCSPRHVRYVANGQRPGSHALVAKIKANIVRPHTTTHKRFPGSAA